MTIRKKILGVIFSLFVVMGILIYAINRFWLINGYIELETRDMIKTTGQVAERMEADLSALKRTVGDWAPWDDTYQFIQELNASYIDNNLMYSTLANLNLNFMLFVDTEGRIKFLRVIDLENETLLDEKEEDYTRLLETYPMLLRNEAQQEVVSGYAVFNDHIVRICSAPIMTSQFQGPVMGTLVMGNYINHREIKRLEKNLKIPLEIQKTMPANSGRDFFKEETRSMGNRFLIERPDRHMITSSIVFESLSKDPLFTLEVKKNRDIYLQGEQTLIYLLLSLGGVGLLFMMAVLIFLEKTVLYRLHRLSTDVKKIARQGHGKDRVLMSGKDEIASLSLDINQMLEKLRENEKRYHTLFESASDPILLLKEDLIVDCNLKALEFFGCEKNQMIGKNPGFFSPETQPDGEPSILKFRKMMETSLAKDVFLLEWLYLKNDNTVFETEMNLARIDLPSGNHIQAIIRDITERKQSETDRLRAQKIAADQEKFALIGRIAGKMAHDFNNILGVIMGNAELSLMDCPHDKTRKTLELIFEQTRRGKNMTKNLVAFAKDQEPKQEFFNINDKIDLVLNLMRKDLEGIEVVTEKSRDMPELLADPGMIEHALINLIQNSIHALSLTEAPCITLRTYSRENSVCFEIEDNGCGIPQESLDRIYEPSFTLKGSKDISGSYKAGIKGTGYGMSNIKKYIEQHKGNIAVESKPGAGTQFTVSLPVIGQELTIGDKTKTQKGRVCFEKYILLVEDENDIAEVQSRILMQAPCNHRVDIAGDGPTAMDLFGRNPYDLVSLDYVLPGDMNGMDVYHHIRSLNKTIPVLFISGNIEFLESIKDLKQKDPCIDHLSKPCQNKEYMDTISRLFERTRAY
ncbi:MAG: ATP-binding protein [Desulfobacteraceae bacterium]|nr:ATP-binding protein [Desulfobacteraceae bacterium]